MAIGVSSVTFSAGFLPSRRKPTSVSTRRCALAARHLLDGRGQRRRRGPAASASGSASKPMITTLPVRLRALSASIAPSAMSSLAATITSGGFGHAGERRFGHRQALGAVEAGGLLEDDLVLVRRLVEDVVQALVAVDGRAGAGLALQVHDRWRRSGTSS